MWTYPNLQHVFTSHIPSLTRTELFARKNALCTWRHRTVSPSLSSAVSRASTAVLGPSVGQGQKCLPQRGAGADPSRRCHLGRLDPTRAEDGGRSYMTIHGALGEGGVKKRQQRDRWPKGNRLVALKTSIARGETTWNLHRNKAQNGSPKGIDSSTQSPRRRSKSTFLGAFSQQSMTMRMTLRKCK